MSPKKAFQQIASDLGFGNAHDDMFKLVVFGSHSAVLNIIFYNSELIMNDASGDKHRIQYCDPNSIERFEELMTYHFNIGVKES